MKPYFKAMLCALCLGSMRLSAVEVNLANCDVLTDQKTRTECYAQQKIFTQRLSEAKLSIGSKILARNCTLQELVDLDSDIKDRMERQLFRQVLCTLPGKLTELTGITDAKSIDNPKPNVDRINIDAVDAQLNLLRAGITRGLADQEFAFARYIEFVLEAQKAAAYYSQYLGKAASNNIRERLLFCSARLGAQTLLNKIDWSASVFSFQTGVMDYDNLNMILPQLVSSSLAADGALANNKGSVCLEVMGFAQGDMEKAINDSLDEAIAPYFDARSPILAMIQRKTSRLTGPAEFLKTKVEEMKQAATAQAGLLANMEAATAETLRDASAEANEYQKTYEAVTSVAEWFDRFKKGLFLDPSGEDTLLILRQSYDRVFDPTCGSLPAAMGIMEIREKCVKVPSKTISPDKSVDALAVNLQNFQARFRSLIAGEEEYKKATKYLCGVYFCQILPSASFITRLNSHCATTTDKQLCVPSGANPRQKYQVGSIARDVEQICKDAAFNQDWMKSKLVQTEATKCLNEMIK